MTNYHEERLPLPTPGRLVRELHLRRPPWWMMCLFAVVVIATWVPLVIFYRVRGTTSPQPRIHFFLDMDKQAKFGPQATHPWFADGRAMRGPIEGTIARGHLRHDAHFYDGFKKDDASGAIHFLSTFPSQVTVDETLIERGQQRYVIYCAVCHGAGGVGDGPVNRRAIELKEAKWVPATNLMTQEVRDRANGQIFQAIRDGVRNMPSYGSQIDSRDRWAIVAYVRHLQSTSPVAAPAASDPGAQGESKLETPTGTNP